MKRDSSTPGRQKTVPPVGMTVCVVWIRRASSRNYNMCTGIVEDINHEIRNKRTAPGQAGAQHAVPLQLILCLKRVGHEKCGRANNETAPRGYRDAVVETELREKKVKWSWLPARLHAKRSGRTRANRIPFRGSYRSR